ncbi:hypothetical protein ACGF3J_27810 [Streptomyces sp. NPDC048171]|uniref:hypothetical protein n=1 Tax=unclassified Streptomyces TaxID=2593676 RepID=UPI00136A61DE|nr:hypothetical protein [Streptomyces sp. SID5789]MZE67663.1 hypothetical protein [Streptomyces sp. SID5789]
MGRGEAPWPGVAARRLLLGALLAVTAVTTAACGDSGDQEAGSGTRSARTQPPSPVQACVGAVGYWARHWLAGGEPYGDYQSMGLSNRQYGILREVVAAARVTQRDQGDRAARELIDRQVREACEERYAGGGPSKGPWR